MDSSSSSSRNSPSTSMASPSLSSPSTVPSTSMASSSTSSPTTPATSSQSWKYDVFLSFRGEDTRKTYVDHLYSELIERHIPTYKDDKTLPRGDSISPSLMRAIEESRIAVIIFSKNYANSSWCLDELTHIMKCRDERGQVVIPIFYDVDPSEVRHQKGKFGEAFHQQKKKNIAKAESWRKALVGASNIAGWEPKNIADGHESEGIKQIVNTILDKLFSLNSYADEGLVGMGTRLQLLKTQLKIGLGGVRMVGIWGVGGGGKTTLASSLYDEISHHFGGHCFVDNIREESGKHGLKYLQAKVLSTLLKTDVVLQSVEEGKRMIKSRLCCSNVLIVLDDVDHDDQLDALAAKHDWFGEGSRIIITTRDEHLLRTHKVDEISLVCLLSRDEAIQLFRRYAYREDEPVEDYAKLSLRVVSYAAGLPLALKILGRFLYDKDKNEWMSMLARLDDNPEMEIVEKLKISYDGLRPLEKELFLDIACFFRWERVDDAMEILDACGFHPSIGIKVLRQKALITISKTTDGADTFDMHDLVQELGHYIVQGENPHNPEEHSRVWQTQVIDDMCYKDEIKENDKIQVIKYDGGSSRFPELVSHMKKVRLLYLLYADHDFFHEGPTFLSNELRYINWPSYPASPLPESFQPTKLAQLNLASCLQKELWKGYKLLPRLKKLNLHYMKNLVSTPNFDGLPCLEELSVIDCSSLVEIHSSLGNHTSLVKVKVRHCVKLRKFPTIIRMKKLETLEIIACKALHKLEMEGNKMEKLKTLDIQRCSTRKLLHKFPEIQRNKPILPYLKYLTLSALKNLLNTPDFDGLPCLEELLVSQCYSLEEIHPSLGNHTSLVKVRVNECGKLRMFPTIIRMEKLETLEISKCRMLHKFPEIQGNLDNLVELSLEKVGIEVFPILSVTECCTSLISLKLVNCHHLKSIEGNFHASKCLKELRFGGLPRLKDMPKISLIDENCCLEKLCLRPKIELCFFGFHHMRRCLRKLDLRFCKLEDGEIPSDIGKLSNIEELDLSVNSFSRLHFSLSQLTRLKLLILTNCVHLVELPDLPSSIAILKAGGCSSLTSIGDGHTNYKELSLVILSGRKVTGASNLLESMLQGDAIENRSMFLRVEGVEIPKRFTPLFCGSRCALQLSENWCNDFSGFLMCGVFTSSNYVPLEITMAHGNNGSCVRKDSFDDDSDAATWVGYVSFASLRHTTWWDSTSNTISFFVHFQQGYHINASCTGFGVRLVPWKRKRASRPMEITQVTKDPFEDGDDYRHKFDVNNDSKSTLKISVDILWSDYFIHVNNVVLNSQIQS